MLGRAPTADNRVVRSARASSLEATPARIERTCVPIASFAHLTQSELMRQPIDFPASKPHPFFSEIIVSGDALAPWSQVLYRLWYDRNDR
jgi:hypothetical protein